MLQVDYIVAALPRSGSHAIPQWLLMQAENVIEQPLVNSDIQPYPNELMWSRDDRKLALYHNTSGIKKMKIVGTDRFDRVALRLERYFLHEITDVTKQVYAEKKFVVVRSFHNWVVSRNKGPLHNMQPREMRAFREYTGELIKEDKGFFHDWYFISYDRWESDIDYRRQICEDNSLLFTDFGKKINTAKGGGTAFPTLNRLDRWRGHENIIRKYKHEKECIENSTKLFGWPEELKLD